jgi:two-component system response regulator DegU
MKILIVDDNRAVRRLVRHAISEIADEVIERSDGDEALAAYIEHRPDLVLMDVRMPRMDGLVATRLLKGQFPEARIFMVTDYDDDQVRSAAMEAGASGYALKQNLTELDTLLSCMPPKN